MQKMMSHMRSAMEKYNMIQDGDRVAVGLSGGKDSTAMLVALANMRRFYPHKYELVAISLDPCFGGRETDFSPLEKLCKELEVEYIIKRTQLGEIIFETRKEKNPCSLCAKMRRGALHDAAKAAGCNKVALGHHMDDAAETFLMNLLNGGYIGCFSPVTYMSRKDIFVIRPMIFCRESEPARIVRRMGLPVVKSRCPADGVTERESMKEQLTAFEKKYGDIRSKIITAMQHKGIDGWGIVEDE
ncbi:MAG: tRNA 2-thiocytidine biosynthesis protein TtcA [Clostridia bacterium]|nr:tRNA 2-thiocytidine biosynthesis protein TtcA [Clostridia bacterium]MBQ6930673.1 tRNA 2-thiocytidine biosynthesis protein TtcA [Clostridia bacterium]MBR4049403.1 tRNA 2-thiocytidine biosynthesis protein TtcA [Clostridia bacterium]